MRPLVVAGFVCLALTASAERASAQLGALLSPGPLSEAHASLEGLTNCQSCHERGRRVTAEKCLACHRPIADRIAKGVGVHRTVKADCVTCHSEHAGRDGELRPFDQQRFDHAAVARFALDGKHSPVATQCAACHKARSFLTLSSGCASCHADVHKGALGASCTSCHSARTAFKDLSGRFDHTKAAFPLVGAHRTVACASCHLNKTFKGLKFSTCTDCHRDPHPQNPPAVTAQAPRFGTACSSCHTNDTWRTRKVNHAQTAFPLIGGHAGVDCAACHKQPAMRVKPRSDSCAACHVDVHRGSFKQDCGSCHNESSFKKAPFNHTQTAFALTGKHSALACSACHKEAGSPTPRPVQPRTASTRAAQAVGRPANAAAPIADFRGLKSSCLSCHVDEHRAELGTSCETCHTTDSFRLPNYTHPRLPEFFAGQHATIACSGCHIAQPPTQPARTGAIRASVSFKKAVTTCTSCHKDVHLGQEGTQCESCHNVRTAKFAVPGFSHVKTGFTLTGRHEAVACALCHKVETGVFPAGSGTATRLKGVARECRGCHLDPHLGQLSTACESCHTAVEFRLPRYTHRNRSLSGFFAGRHTAATCESCHKPFTGQFPAGRGTAVLFQTDTRCLACHDDIHRGALGPRCADCHRP